MSVAAFRRLSHSGHCQRAGRLPSSPAATASIIFKRSDCFQGCHKLRLLSGSSSLSIPCNCRTSVEDAPFGHLPLPLSLIFLHPIRWPFKSTNPAEIRAAADACVAEAASHQALRATTAPNDFSASSDARALLQNLPPD